MNLKTYIASGERGRATKLAIGLGVSPSYLSQMANGSSAVSPERCVEIEILTAGNVTRPEMRPSDWRKIWPELSNMHPDISLTALVGHSASPSASFASP